MIILPTNIEQTGPGVRLASSPSGLAINMSDPVRDFEYAAEAVTLTYDLWGAAQVHLRFEAKESGDEPHSPKDEEGRTKDESEEGAAAWGPVADFDFDGVAVSADGVAWYEVQGLRHLRSDRVTAFDLDLDAPVAAAGLTYGRAFRIQFCQYDDNPAPMDGIEIRRIALEGDFPGLCLHLRMDDNAASPLVTDSGPGHHDQTLTDPTGNPNTAAHATAGPVGGALLLDGVDDAIVVPSAQVGGGFAPGGNFTVALWWRCDSNPFANGYKVAVSGYTSANGGIILFQSGNPGGTWRAIYMNFYVAGNGAPLFQPYTEGAENVGQWHHYAFVREGQTLRAWRDGALLGSLTDAAVAGKMGEGNPFRIGWAASSVAGAVDDFRVYDRALGQWEVRALAGL